MDKSPKPFHEKNLVEDENFNDDDDENDFQKQFRKRAQQSNTYNDYQNSDEEEEEEEGIPLGSLEEIEERAPEEEESVVSSKRNKTKTHSKYKDVILGLRKIFKYKNCLYFFFTYWRKLLNNTSVTNFKKFRAKTKISNNSTNSFSNSNKNSLKKNSNVNNVPGRKKVKIPKKNKKIISNEMKNKLQKILSLKQKYIYKKYFYLWYDNVCSSDEDEDYISNENNYIYNNKINNIKEYTNNFPTYERKELNVKSENSPKPQTKKIAFRIAPQNVEKKNNISPRINQKKYSKLRAIIEDIDEILDIRQCFDKWIDALNSSRIFLYDGNYAYNEIGKDYSKENYWKYSNNDDDYDNYESDEEEENYYYGKNYINNNNFHTRNNKYENYKSNINSSIDNSNTIPNDTNNNFYKNNKSDNDSSIIENSNINSNINNIQNKNYKSNNNSSSIDNSSIRNNKNKIKTKNNKTINNSNTFDKTKSKKNTQNNIKNKNNRSNNNSNSFDNSTTKNIKNKNKKNRKLNKNLPQIDTDSISIDLSKLNASLNDTNTVKIGENEYIHFYATDNEADVAPNSYVLINGENVPLSEPLNGNKVNVKSVVIEDEPEKVIKKKSYKSTKKPEIKESKTRIKTITKNENDEIEDSGFIEYNTQIIDQPLEISEIVTSKTKVISETILLDENALNPSDEEYIKNAIPKIVVQNNGIGALEYNISVPEKTITTHKKETMISTNPKLFDLNKNKTTKKNYNLDFINIINKHEKCRMQRVNLINIPLFKKKKMKPKILNNLIKLIQLIKIKACLDNPLMKYFDKWFNNTFKTIDNNDISITNNNISLTSFSKNDISNTENSHAKTVNGIEFLIQDKNKNINDIILTIDPKTNELILQEPKKFENLNNTNGSIDVKNESSDFADFRKSLSNDNFSSRKKNKIVDKYSLKSNKKSNKSEYDDDMNLTQDDKFSDEDIKDKKLKHKIQKYKKAMHLLRKAIKMVHKRRKNNFKEKLRLKECFLKWKSIANGGIVAKKSIKNKTKNKLRTIFKIYEKQKYYWEKITMGKFFNIWKNRIYELQKEKNAEKLEESESTINIDNKKIYRSNKNNKNNSNNNNKSLTNKRMLTIIKKLKNIVEKKIKKNKEKLKKYLNKWKINANNNKINISTLRPKETRSKTNCNLMELIPICVTCNNNNNSYSEKNIASKSYDRSSMKELNINKENKIVENKVVKQKKCYFKFTKNANNNIITITNGEDKNFITNCNGENNINHNKNNNTLEKEKSDLNNDDSFFYTTMKNADKKVENIISKKLIPLFEKINKHNLLFLYFNKWHSLIQENSILDSTIKKSNTQIQSYNENGANISDSINMNSSEEKAKSFNQKLLGNKSNASKKMIIVENELISERERSLTPSKKKDKKNNNKIDASESENNKENNNNEEFDFNLENGDNANNENNENKEKTKKGNVINKNAKINTTKNTKKLQKNEKNVKTEKTVKNEKNVKVEKKNLSNIKNNTTKKLILPKTKILEELSSSCMEEPSEAFTIKTSNNVFPEVKLNIKQAIYEKSMKNNLVMNKNINLINDNNYMIAEIENNYLCILKKHDLILSAYRIFYLYYILHNNIELYKIKFVFRYWKKKCLPNSINRIHLKSFCRNKKHCVGCCCNNKCFDNCECYNKLKKFKDFVFKYPLIKDINPLKFYFKKWKKGKHKVKTKGKKKKTENK